jgi:two-component system, sensor histidine kinase and response regulator
VLANLVGNACQYGAPSAPVEVTVDGSAADAVVLAVRSEGAIPREQRAHLFNPFRRGAGSAGAGLGLGLYIVEQVVRGHGGTVEVLDEDGCTVFRVRLPRHGVAPT